MKTNHRTIKNRGRRGKFITFTPGPRKRLVDLTTENSSKWKIGDTTNVGGCGDDIDGRYKILDVIPHQDGACTLKLEKLD